jgi:hypothetical protein
MLHSILTAETTSAPSATDLATVGPSLTAPLAGDYRIEANVTIVDNSGAGAYATAEVQINGVSQENFFMRMAGAGVPAGPIYRRYPTKTITAAGHIVRMKYSAGGGGTASFNGRVLTILPVRAI